MSLLGKEMSVNKQIEMGEAIARLKSFVYKNYDNGGFWVFHTWTDADYEEHLSHSCRSEKDDLWIWSAECALQSYWQSLTEWRNEVSAIRKESKIAREKALRYATL